MNSILTDTGVVSNALATLVSHQPELATARRDVVIRSEFRYSGTPLISLSHTNIGVVDNVTAPPGAGPC